jgi:5-carboxyvanillate decarboxylase
MKTGNSRRTFLRHLLSLMAFSAGTGLSFRKGIDGRITGQGTSTAHAADGQGKRIKKIAVEEHFTKEGVAQITDRLKEMDQAGIDMQVLSATLTPNDKLTAAEAKAWAIETNNAFAGVVEKYPARFSSFAAVALHEPQEAARELERAVTQLGFKGALIGAEDRTFLDDPEYWVFLETAEKLGVPIYLHPKVPGKDMVNPYLKYPILSRSMWGFAAEASLHSLRLILGGMFEKYPRLQIILGHLGESIPFQLWRLDNRWTNEKDGRTGMFAADPSATNMKKKPSEYFKEHFYVTTSGMFWEPALQLVHTAMGPDRILFAVDYSAESNMEAVKFIESVKLSNEDREKICHGNAERLLKL